MTTVAKVLKYSLVIALLAGAGIAYYYLVYPERLIRDYVSVDSYENGWHVEDVVRLKGEWILLATVPERFSVRNLEYDAAKEKFSMWVQSRCPGKRDRWFWERAPFQQFHIVARSANYSGSVECTPDLDRTRLLLDVLGVKE